MGLEKDTADGYTPLHAYTPTNAAMHSASDSRSDRSPLQNLGAWSGYIVANEVDWTASIGRDTARGAGQLGGDMGARSGLETANFLSVDEAAELLSISKRTIYGWVQQGRIPYRKAGRRLLFLESELLEWTKPDSRRQYLELTR